MRIWISIYVTFLVFVCRVLSTGMLNAIVSLGLTYVQSIGIELKITGVTLTFTLIIINILFPVNHC
jgi:hypothetical protein